MFVRDKKGNIIRFEVKKYNTTKDLYKEFWKIKYNKTIYTKSNKIDSIVDYIEGKTNIIF